MAKTVKSKAMVERKYAMEWVRRRRSKILKNYKKLLKKVKPARYYYWEANAAYAYQLGSSDGYDTLESLMRDQKYNIDRAKEGESIAVILKATPYKIIKARATGGKRENY